jgi:hypothetical protein
MWNMFNIVGRRPRCCWEDDFKMHLRSGLQEYAHIPVAISNRRTVACIEIFNEVYYMNVNK